MEKFRVHESSRQVSYRARALKQSLTLSQQAISDRSKNKTFIDAIMKLSIHLTTNCSYTASFIIVNHLAFCQAWSLNEYVKLGYVMSTPTTHSLNLQTTRT